MSTYSTETIRGDLWKVRRDMEDTKEALAAYWTRGSSDTDYKVADMHMAAEALMRAVSTLALTVERVAGLP